MTWSLTNNLFVSVSDPYNRAGRRATFSRDVVHGAKEPKEVIVRIPDGVSRFLM